MPSHTEQSCVLCCLIHARPHEHTLLVLWSNCTDYITDCIQVYDADNVPLWVSVSWVKDHPHKYQDAGFSTGVVLILWLCFEPYIL